MLDIRGLTKKYGNTIAVNNVSLTIETGEMVAVIGRSGAGKSTLLRCINGLESIDSGEIYFDGLNVAKLKGTKLNNWRSNCAMIFQQFQLVPRLDVLTNVLIGCIREQSFLPAMLKSFSAEQRARAVLELDKLGMAEAALKRAQNLSGGQQQRVAIARAMMQDPKILLADEPIASLDPRNSHAVMSTLREINQTRNITTLVNLHAMDIAREYCDRVIALKAGEIVFDGSAKDIDETMMKLVFDEPEEKTVETE